MILSWSVLSRLFKYLISNILESYYIFLLYCSSTYLSYTGLSFRTCFFDSHQLIDLEKICSTRFGYSCLWGELILLAYCTGCLYWSTYAHTKNKIYVRIHAEKLHLWKRLEPSIKNEQFQILRKAYFYSTSYPQCSSYASIHMYIFVSTNSSLLWCF